MGRTRNRLQRLLLLPIARISGDVCVRCRIIILEMRKKFSEFRESFTSTAKEMEAGEEQRLEEVKKPQVPITHTCADAQAQGTQGGFTITTQSLRSATVPSSHLQSWPPLYCANHNVRVTHFKVCP